ncbi:immunoglobulin domain-containing protein [Pedosphaera parvula]|uniref:Immunoglobulin I-set domain protein n=1 Tax=Pedosphaera parvula (strain Ellin514) TaxID=320771 RepID=B9XEU0_PEDPL|nr:hypothetical protein [Pedosphaera parvula]EEF61804.1 Immunoglobulin I-set domain protein [Pedosphaera parvula Ellin514]
MFKLCRFARLTFVLLLFAGFSRSTHATPDLRFDVVWFCCPCYPDNHLCQTQFDHLNFSSPNGHYLAMTTDAHRAEVNAAGNVLAGYYNTLTDGWTTNSAAQKAALIDDYITSGFTTGPKPAYLVLNEISAGNWPSDATYRAWLRAVVHTLNTTYGYTVILYSPFPNPAANNADWQALSTDCYIAVENYLSGLAIKNNGFSLSWCQSQYQSSVTSYANRGVPKSRLMLGEHFGQTSTDLPDGTTVTWGRNTASFSDWDAAINVRSLAARNVGFPGFLSYAWYSDTMLAPDPDLIHFEDTYGSNSLPTSNPLTPPFIITQPQSQTIAPGGITSFSVITAGNAALVFQWKFNGARIPGATNNSLTLTNISPANAGHYSVLVSNTVGTTNSLNAVLDVKIPDPLAADTFAPGLTPYTIGSNLVGQTNSSGRYWTAAGPVGANISILSTNLTIPGLAPSTGNAILVGASTGPSARFNLTNAITAGTLYYSFAFQVTDLGQLNTSGGFFAGFNNSLGSQGTTPTVIGAGVQTKLAASGYNIGLKKASSGSLFDTTTYTTGQTIFVVGSYTLNTNSASDDLANLWINPDPTTFGAGLAPAPTLSTTSGTDITANQIASFLFFRRGDASATLQPAALIADELRIGTTWASVTPPLSTALIPTLSVTQFGNNIILSWTTNTPAFTLESNTALDNTNTWTPVQTPVQTSGNQFIVTNAIASSPQFYRLQKQ